VLGVVALAYPLWSVGQVSQAYPYNLVPYVALVWLLAGVATFLYLRSRAPEKLATVGSFLADDGDGDDGRPAREAVPSAHGASSIT